MAPRTWFTSTVRLASARLVYTLASIPKLSIFSVLLSRVAKV